MNFIFLKTITLLLLLLPSVHGATSSQSRDEFCSDRGELNYLQSLLLENESRIAFQNQGGLANGGVCWWHSRFQRNAIYLNIYQPQMRRPSLEEAKSLINKMKKGREVVVVPGFSNLKDFTEEYRQETQKALEAWQRFDGLVLQQWVLGLSGNSEVSRSELAQRMDLLFEQISQGDVVYQKLQIKGIRAHSWLVLGMLKKSNGYDLFVVDSNYNLSTNTYHYEYGDRSLFQYGYGNFVPYTEQNSELKRLNKVIDSHCEDENV